MDTEGVEPSNGDAAEQSLQQVHLAMFASASASGFFDAAQADREPPESPGLGFEERRHPEWLGPDDQVLGATVAVTPLLIVRTTQVCLAMETVTAYPTGVSFEIAMRLRRGDWDEDRWDEVQETAFGHHRRHRVRSDLLVGVALADGSRAVAADNWHRMPDVDNPPTPPVLLERGSGGGSSSATTLTSSRRYWLWPLPQGDLTIVIAWPTFEIAEHSVTVPAGPLNEAAAHALTVWP